MRDKNRIEPTLAEIAKYWKLVPDWRFCQLIVNVFGTSNVDPFFLEEKDILELFDNFFEVEKK